MSVHKIECLSMGGKNPETVKVVCPFVYDPCVKPVFPFQVFKQISKISF